MGLSEDQVSNIRTVLARCKAHNANSLCTEAIMCAGWGESAFHTHDVNHLGCDGCFQACPPPIGSGVTFEHRFDTAWMADKWLTSGFWIHGGGLELSRLALSPGYIANQVEGAYSDLNQGAAYYNQYLSQARWAISNFHGSVGATQIPSSSDQPPSSGGIYDMTAYLNWSGNVDNAFKYLAGGADHLRSRSAATRRWVRGIDFVTSKWKG